MVYEIFAVNSREASIFARERKINNYPCIYDMYICIHEFADCS